MTEDLDAWRCPDCDATGRVWRYHQVTHQLGKDRMELSEDCETCSGIGWLELDAEQPAAQAGRVTPFTAPSKGWRNQ